MTNAESQLLQELNNAISYCKQQVTKAIFELHVEHKVDVSREDLSRITEKVGLSLDHVYRDVARNFNAIREDIKRDKEEMKKDFEEKLAKK